MRNRFFSILFVVLALLTFLAPMPVAKADPGGGNQITFNDFINALNMVESSGKRTNVPPGDGGAAIGSFQIHRACWQDAVQHDPSIGGKYSDCNNYDYSVKIVRAYLHRYGAKFIKTDNWEALARIWNGGPAGYKRTATLSYWRRVQSNL